MTWHHLRAAPRDRGARILDETPLVDLLPGLCIIETDFEIPGRGLQAAVAVDIEGRLTLVETSRTVVDALPAGLLDRIAWFDAHRALLPRLFGDLVRPDRRPHAAIVAPGFGESLTRSNTLDDALHLLRVRALTAPTGDLFALVESARSGPNGDPSDDVHPLLDPARAPGRVAETQASGPLAGSRDDGAAARSVASFRPHRRSTPDELLRRSRNWLEKLSPDITTADVEGQTRFLFHDQPLVDIRATSEQLELEIPQHGRLTASDSHELNACMQQVITRYFSLVGSDDNKFSRLRKEDILTERELAEFVPPPPDR